MPENIRIAFFADVLQLHFDGVSNTIHQLASQMPPHIEPVFFVALPPREEDGFQFTFHQLPYVGLPLNEGYRIGLPKSMRTLPKILEDFKPHLVHFSSPSLMGRYAIRYAKKHQLPLTCIYHTHFHSYMSYYFGSFKPLEWAMTKLAWRLSRWFYTQPDMTFVPSRPMKEFLLSLGVPDEKIAYFRRGIDYTQFGQQFRDETIWEQWGIQNQRIILFVSRLVEEKETATMKAIYNLLEEERKDVRLVITGDGPARPSMERHMPNAVFTGKRTKVQLAAIYASADVFVFPSLTETFGNVVLEALASGLPAVVAAAGGPQGIVEESGAGYVVQPKDARAFVDHLTAIVDQPKLKKELADKGVAYAKKQRWETISAAYFDQVTQLVRANQNS